MSAKSCAMAPLVEADRDGRLGHREVASLERHLEACASCAAMRGRLGRIADHIRRPRGPRSPLSHQRGRLALLRAAAHGLPRSASRRGHLVLAVAVLLLGSVAGVAAVAHRADPVAVARRMPRPALTRGELDGQPAARVETVLIPSEGARFERLGSPPDVERIHLTEGAIDLAVRHLLPGERFLVTTADAEVEVRGTVFRVEATDGRIRQVSVREGKVEVRHLGASSLIPAGGAWRPVTTGETPHPVVARGETSAQAASTAPRPVAAPPRPPSSASPREEASKSFASGVGLLERGDYATAADSLDAFRRAHPGDPRAEDAAYLTILSLQRAGRSAAAAEAARRFLVLYPGSARRGAVQNLLEHP